MEFLEKALSFIFPPTCGICGKQNTTYLCTSCFEKLQKENKMMCQIEEYIGKASGISEHCYLFAYEGIIRQKILQYKFGGQAYLSKMFSEFFVKNEKICGFLKKYDIIVAVPMTKKKLARRGYNQSELIASRISKYTKISFEKQILIKSVENQTQSTLNKMQRLENVKNVYKIKNEQKIEEKAILIFDDIYTTGATASECAKVLLEAGAKTVGVLTIAKDFKKI